MATGIIRVAGIFLSRRCSLKHPAPSISWPWICAAMETAAGRILGKESCALIGHSLGGSPAMLFAGVFPAQVRKLIMIESTGPYARSDEEVPRLLGQWLA